MDMYRIIDASICIDAEKLVEKLVVPWKVFEKEDYDFDGGEGRFIKFETREYIIACCFHNTKRHKAWVEVHNKVNCILALVDQAKWISECEAGAGKWAIAWCYSDIFGRNEAYYKCLDY